MHGVLKIGVMIVPDKGARRGRPPTTSAAEIARAALSLFVRDGFEATSLERVAAAAGVSRRTLFQYFPSKSAIVWHGAAEAYQAMLATLAAGAADAPWRAVLAEAMVASLRFPEDDLEALRLRLRLIDAEPSLQAHLHTDTRSALAALAARIAAGSGSRPDDLEPFVLARASWVATFSALIWWARSGDGDPRDAVRRALALVGLDGPNTRVEPSSDGSADGRAAPG